MNCSLFTQPLRACSLSQSRPTLAPTPDCINICEKKSNKKFNINTAECLHNMWHRECTQKAPFASSQGCPEDNTPCILHHVFIHTRPPQSQALPWAATHDHRPRWGTEATEEVLTAWAEGGWLLVATALIEGAGWRQG